MLYYLLSLFSLTNLLLTSILYNFSLNPAQRQKLLEAHLQFSIPDNDFWAFFWLTWLNSQNKTSNRFVIYIKIHYMFVKVYFVRLGLIFVLFNFEVYFLKTFVSFFTNAYSKYKKKTLFLKSVFKNSFYLFIAL